MAFALFPSSLAWVLLLLCGCDGVTGLAGKGLVGEGLAGEGLTGEGLTGEGLVGEGLALWQRLQPSPVSEGQLPLQDTFPEGFLWGAGTSAFQTEGSSSRDGRGPSIWDRFRSPAATADEASDSYRLWEEDVAALKYLGASSYAFSLSWPRLFPNGTTSGGPNAAGVAHYGRVINRLRREGIEPVVTLFHWDLPLALQEDLGGWRNKSLVDIFDDYAAFCFRTYGSRVKYWITVHNPFLVAWQGYRTGLHAPGEAGEPGATFAVAHNLIRAHAKVWHTYDRYFRPHQHGYVSITLGSHWMKPAGHQANVQHCQESMEAVLGWFAEPIHGSGDYPASLKRQNPGLVPEFTKAERQLVRGTADFFALSFGPNNAQLGQALTRYGQQVSLDLRQALNWIKLEYENPRVLITENGWFSYATVGTEDTVAIYLMKRFISQVLQAIVHDSVQVFGYTAWSLVDGFEWNDDYRMRRGLFYVDFNSPDRARLPRTSAKFYRQVIADNGFPSSEMNQDVKGRFPCDFHWGVTDTNLQVRLRPFSPQFTDPHLYLWNVTGNGVLRPVEGVRLQTRGAQCSDYLAIQKHLDLLQATGADHYSFALNWSLILPRGDLLTIDREALRYYRCMAKELRRRNIQPMVILYYPTHHSPFLGLPAPLHSAGGWLNGGIVGAFREYSKLCFRELGPWVPLWITINEPNHLSQAYNASDPYRAAHHLVLAHAAAWRLYDKEFRAQQGALVSFSLHADWVEPANPFLESDAAAAKRFLLFNLAYFLDPFLGGREGDGTRRGGDYPADVREYLREKESLRLFHLSLPRFTEQEREEVRGALDFIALNHFTTHLASHKRTNSSLSRLMDHDCWLTRDHTWPSSNLKQNLVPWGLRRVLRWSKERYGEASIFITASGVDDQASKNDQIRQFYLRSYLQEALKAYQMDGVNLRGFYAWKLQDRHGPRFGLFSSPSSSHLQGVAKGSVSVYRDIIARGGGAAVEEEDGGALCGGADAKPSCALCDAMLGNRPLLFFGACVFLTLTLLVALILFWAKRKQRGPPRAAPYRPRRPRGRGPHIFNDSCLKFSTT
ncbi:beta-klotho [Anguilla rostrata]|uniref:beta-klotho n=1 Tax=Anguilla rostrata TaxID=7938 RepID=UPI0030D212B4